jgi:hypothetical protein
MLCLISSAASNSVSCYITELFHTERSHVRNLKVIDHVFYRPIVDTQILPSEYVQLLFSNLDEVLCIHSQFNNLLKVKRHDSPVVGDIAEILLSMVSVSSLCVCVCVCVWKRERE